METGESLWIIEIVKPALVELIECDFEGMKVEHKRKRRESETMVEAMSDRLSTQVNTICLPFIYRDSIECKLLF